MNKLLILFLTPFIGVYSLLAQNETFEVSKGAYNNAGTVVAALKMNVFYIGVDNPLDIAVPGIPAKDLSATMVGGSIKRDSDGHFTATVTSPGKCAVVVSVRGREVSRTDFRVKRIPDPVVTLGGRLRGGNMQPGVLQAQSGIMVVLENFDFEMLFRVKSFALTASSKGKSQTLAAVGPVFTPEMKAMIAALKTGDVLTVEDVLITGPALESRRLGPISFTVL